MRILFLGDSVTDCDHCFSADGLGYGYVGMLAESLRSIPAFYGRELSLINGGSDGLSIAGIQRKYHLFYEKETYDQIVLLGGINDVGMIMDTGHTREEGRALLRQSARIYGELAKTLLEAADRLILAEPFLFPQKTAWLRLWMPELAYLKSEIRSNMKTLLPDGKRILYCRPQEMFDSYQEKHPHLSLSEDGIHPNASGHRLLCEQLLTLLSEDFF